MVYEAMLKLNDTFDNIDSYIFQRTGDRRKLQLIVCLDFPVLGRYLSIYPSMTSEATYIIFLFTLWIAHN